VPKGTRSERERARAFGEGRAERRQGGDLVVPRETHGDGPLSCTTAYRPDLVEACDRHVEGLVLSVRFRLV
jgi:hypothetical protein